MTTCELKLYFATRKLAKGKAKQMLQKNKNHLSVYKCPFCDGFHTTSKTTMGYKMTARGSR